MKHKIMQAMKTSNDEHQLFGFVQLDDAYWAASKRETEVVVQVIKVLLLRQLP